VTNFLERLAGRAIATPSQSALRPRVRSRFEPPAGETLHVDSFTVPPPEDRERDSSPPPASPAAAPRAAVAPTAAAAPPAATAPTAAAPRAATAPTAATAPPAATAPTAAAPRAATAPTAAAPRAATAPTAAAAPATATEASPAAEAAAHARPSTLEDRGRGAVAVPQPAVAPRLPLTTPAPAPYTTRERARAPRPVRPAPSPATDRLPVQRTEITPSEPTSGPVRRDVASRGWAEAAIPAARVPAPPSRSTTREPAARRGVLDPRPMPAVVAPSSPPGPGTSVPATGPPGPPGARRSDARQRPSDPAPVEQPEHVVHVTIGRLEVRGAAPTAPPAARATPRRPPVALDDYLHERTDGRRR
jgi:hypothetical protein